MNRIYRICLALLPLLALASCGGDGDYHYPSVKLDFVTVHTDAKGALSTAETGGGLYYKVCQDLTGKVSTADSTLRIVANYEPVEVPAEASRTTDMKIYSWVTAVSPLPLPASKFEEGVQTDPVSVVGIWRGKDYLNMVLTVREQSGKHRLHFVEEELAADAAGVCRLKLSLYHSVEQGVQDYDKRIYLSVPLAHYFTDGVSRLEVGFGVNTYDEGVKLYDFHFEPTGS